MRTHTPTHTKQKSKQKKSFLIVIKKKFQFETAMINGDFAAKQPLAHMQKDLRLAMSLSEVCEHPTAVTAIANETYKHAKRLGFSAHDASAVYIRSKF